VTDDLTPDELAIARKVRSQQIRAGLANSGKVAGPKRDLTAEDDAAIRAAFDSGARVFKLAR
jgi:hypothetical protein